MRAARPDGVPLRHAGRSGTRTEVVRGALHQRRVDGVILAPCADPERRALDYLSETRMPCVLVDRTPDSAFRPGRRRTTRGDARLVVTSPASGTGASAISAAHPGFETTLERVDGYRAALAEARLSLRRALIDVGQRSTVSAAAGDARLLSLPDPPTALVTGNNLATIGAMSAVRARRLAHARRRLARRLRRFRMGRLLRAAADPRRAAVPEIGQRAAFAADGAHRRRREGARRTMRLERDAGRARLLRERRHERGRRSGPAAPRHARRREELRRRRRRCAASISTFARRGPRAARRERRRQIDADERSLRRHRAGLAARCCSTAHRCASPIRARRRRPGSRRSSRSSTSCRASTSPPISSSAAN